MPIEIKFQHIVHDQIMGAHFANAFGDEQMLFLLGFYEAVQKWDMPSNWSFQCRHILDAFGSDARRLDIARMLEDLADHLRETPDSDQPENQENDNDG